MTDSKQTTVFLSRVPLFRGLKRRQLERLGEKLYARNYAAGQSIVTQSMGGEGLFLIVSGRADVVRERADGEKVVLNTFGPTDFFGELALLDGGLRTASVVATEDTECLALTRWDLLAILKEDADMAVTILQELARRFRRALDVL
jgi:CRP/FNR family cyclic AMP-dependent transcriptional regulator